MPPLPADSIHARACKLKCEKILTRPMECVDKKDAVCTNSKLGPSVAGPVWK